MKLILAIAFGGAVGSVGRYYIAGLAERWFATFLGAGFPYGTVVVNVLGSFVLGALVESFAVILMPSAEVRALVFIGVLGSFTTFSAFSSDTAGFFPGATEWFPKLAARLPPSSRAGTDLVFVLARF